MKTKETEQNYSDYLPVETVANMLRVSTVTVREWIRQGVLEARLLKLNPKSKKPVYSIHIDTVKKILSP